MASVVQLAPMKVSSRLVAVNTATQLFFRGLIVLISLGTTSILTRRLGVEEYAAYGVLTAMISLFFSVSDWGTQLVATREGSVVKQQGRFWWNVLWLRLGLVIGGYLVYLLFIQSSPLFQTRRSVYSWAGLVLFFLSLRTTTQIVFQIDLRHYLSALLDFLAALTFFGLLLVFHPKDLSNVALYLLIAAGLTAVIGLVMVVLRYPPVFKKWPSKVSLILKQSRVMGLVMIVYSLFGKVPILFLQRYSTEQELGYFILSQKVYDNLILGAAYLMNVLYPVISSLAFRKENK
ncbi:oligosaccharide flippase family protein, partial [Patescibacteria group bacterium]|nr:oligosaccharide flippase family protein [Patescibacteria group bacterium]